MRTLVSLLSEPLLEKNAYSNLRPPTTGASEASLVANCTAGTLVVWKKLL